MADKSTLIVTPATQIALERYVYLLEDWIPATEVTILAGEPGLGKTTFALDVAAKLSTGALPGALKGTPSDVLLSVNEDAYGSVIKPRLLAAHADLTRIHFLNALFDNNARGPIELDAATIDSLRRTIQDTGARLLVIDPLLGCLPTGVDAHKDAPVRKVLARLSALAQDSKIAVLGLMHLNKRDTLNVLNKVGASIGFVGVARSVMFLGRDPNAESNSHRILAHAKCNGGAQARSLRYDIVPALVPFEGKTFPSSRLVLLGEAPDVTADDLLYLDADRAARRRGPTKRDRATAFLREELQDGPRPTRELFEGAAKLGISKRTLEEAKERLPIVCFQANGHWYWKFADEVQP